ncbi:unnamed protein product, partial [Sphagnum balticum]
MILAAVCSLICLSTLTAAQILAQTWTATGSLTYARNFHTATQLTNGNLIVGGQDINSVVLNTAELYNATTGLWTVTGSLTYARYSHTATLLHNGNVLVAGGDSIGNTAEVYNASTGVWTVTSSLTYARDAHTATLLPNGNVLVAGGGANANTAELYNAITGVWTVTGSLTTARYFHTATLLPNGNVLVAGGYGTIGYINTAELYNATTGVWTLTGNLTYARYSHTATLLTNGNVLVAGGDSIGNTAEVYNASTGVWTVTSSLTYARDAHTATLLTNGNVLVAAGYNGDSGDLNSAEVYNSTTGVWTLTSNLTYARYSHTATLLSNGNVLVAGGDSVGNTAEVYFIGFGKILLFFSLKTKFFSLVAGCNMTSFASNGAVVSFAASEPGTVNEACPTGYFGSVIQTCNSGSLNWTYVSGSCSDASYYVYTTQVYNRSSNQWTAVGLMTDERIYHGGVVLNDGSVFVCGGSYGVSTAADTLATTEIYNVTTKTWAASSNMQYGRFFHTVTLLQNGTVLITGGFDTTLTAANTWEIFSAKGATLSTYGTTMNSKRAEHTATLLNDGNVLLCGGYSSYDSSTYWTVSSNYLSSCEIFSYTKHTFNLTTVSMTSARALHTASLLSNGNVLLVGGYIGSIVSGAEIYYYLTQNFSSVPSLNTPRCKHVAFTLSNGGVAVIGGSVGATETNKVEIYDPSSNKWNYTTSMVNSRCSFPPVAFANGDMIIIAGYSGAGQVSAVEILHET